jgi:hypothetical protein
VLISVWPPLLAELLARELCRDDLEIRIVDDPVGFGDDRGYAVVITNGLPPSRIRASTLVQLPDRLRGDDIGSLVTAVSVERVPIPELASVVTLVHELCGRAAPDGG